jgi:hypothetical protein
MRKIDCQSVTMNAGDDELRSELEAACAAIRRQLDLLQRSQRSRWGGGGDVLARRALEERLRELRDALGLLGPPVQRPGER